MPVDAGMLIVHQVVAAIWIGTVVFVGVAIIPRATEGDVDSDLLSAIIGTTQTISRIGAFLLLITGSHLLANWYMLDIGDFSPLLETGAGHMVMTMVILWAILIGLVEMGAKRVEAGLEQGKLREPAKAAAPLFKIAIVVAILVSAVAGLINSGLV